MKVAHVTLPLMATILLSGNAVALAGASSALDPYAYIQAPTKAEREAQYAKKNKKAKEKAKKLAALDDTEPAPKRKGIETVPASVIINDRPNRAVAKKVTPAPVKEEAPAPKVAESKEDDSPSSKDGFMDGIRQSTGGIAKSTRAIGAGVGSGFAKIGSGFKGAGSKVKEGTMAAGGSFGVVGDGIKASGGIIKEGAATVGEKLKAGASVVGGMVVQTGMAAGERISDGAKKLKVSPAPAFGAIGAGFSKLNPFDNDKDDAPKAVAEKKGAEKADAKSSKAAKPVTASKPADKKEVVAETANNEEKSEEATATAQNTESPDQKTEGEAQKAAPVKTAEKAAPVKTAAKPEKSGGGFGLGMGMGAAKKIAVAPVAGMSKLGKGFNKLNPFAKDEKPAAPTAIAKKPEKTEKPAETKSESAKPESESSETTPAHTLTEHPTEETVQIGGRLQPKAEIEQEAAEGWSTPESTAATPDAVPH